MRARLVVHRSGVAYWAAAVVLALVAAGLVQRSVDGAEAVRARFGPLTPVPVVARAVPAGVTLTARDVEVRRLPAGLLPAGAAASPVGHAALVPLVKGEVVLRSRLAPWGRTGAAALVPRGMRAIAIPAGPGGRPPLHPGDTVDVLATTDDDGPATRLVATNAVVVAVDADADTVTVAVPADQAPVLAAAAATATITLALA